MRHGVKSLWESWCRAECAPGRTWAAEGNGRRPIVCTRNRTDPILELREKWRRSGSCLNQYLRNGIRAVNSESLRDIGVCLRAQKDKLYQGYLGQRFQKCRGRRE